MLEKLIEKFKNEPVVVSEVVKIATILLSIGVAFGFLESTNSAEIEALLTPIATIIVILISSVLTIFARSKVSPVYKEAKLDNTEAAPE